MILIKNSIIYVNCRFAGTSLSLDAWLTTNRLVWRIFVRIIRVRPVIDQLLAINYRFADRLFAFRRR